MMSLNEHTIIGNLGQDPDIRTLQNGKRVANLSVATNRKFTNRNTGEVSEDTQWHRVSIFTEGLVDVVEKYVNKGDAVMVRGEGRTRKWQDQSGNDRYTYEIVVSGPNSLFRLMGSTGDNTSNANQPNANGGADFNDEIPF